MILAGAQIAPHQGDISKNLALHSRAIEVAHEHRVDVLLFPELSLTGYEPALADTLALSLTDRRLAGFQDLSARMKMIIGVGTPLRTEPGVQISMILFYPDTHTQVYAKRYLHADEKPYFVPGSSEDNRITRTDIGLAICYELSVATHFETSHRQGISVYAASVAKSTSGVVPAHRRLCELSSSYGMVSFMVNSVGSQDNFMAAGQSAVWCNGRLVGAMGKEDEGLLIYDDETQECRTKLL